MCCSLWICLFTDEIIVPQVQCGITWTTPETHAIIAENIDQSAVYSGAIAGRGPRYCPSIEDKVHRFADKDRHQIFLEPEKIWQATRLRRTSWVLKLEQNMVNMMKQHSKMIQIRC